VYAGRLTLAFSLLLAIACATPAAAAPGDLDPSFGTFGKYLSPPDHNTTVDKVLVRSDGEILVGGSSWAESNGGLTYRATVFGFTPDGEPDPLFGQGGRAVLPSTFGDASIALQGDKTVVAASDARYRLVVYRLNADGSLDTSFGTGGVAETGLSAGYNVTPQIAVSPNQTIAVVSSSSPIAGLIVARLLPDGQGFDPSFAGGVVYADANPNTAVQAVAAGPGDEVTLLASNYSATARVLRFKGDGTPDQTFGPGGQATVSPDGSAYLADLALRPDGSSVLAGYLTSNFEGVVAALTPNGRLDPSFASDGATELPNGEDGSLDAVGIDSQGRILTAGSGSRRVRLARFLSNGRPDPAFGTNGVASGGFGGAVTQAESLAFTSDGRIVVAAERVTGFRSDFLLLGLMRFLVSEGPRDPDADSVVGRRDRCPELAGTARNHGCPLLPRDVELTGFQHSARGVVQAARRCTAIDRASIFVASPGRDDRFGRVTINARGHFHARFEPGFRGHVYARLYRHLNPEAGICGPARSNTDFVGVR
jgi:uncharacterized delta-60 repeat protein